MVDIQDVVKAMLGRNKGNAGLTVEKVIKNSLQYVIEFLEDRRKRYQQLGVRDAELMCALDTALLKAYALTRKGAQLDAFASGENHVDLEEGSHFLRGAKLFHVLALLYRSRGMSREALTMWMQMGKADDRFTEAGYNGVNETIEYLSTLDDHELVWAFSNWVLKEDTMRAMRIFTTNERATPLRPERVLEHLKSFEDLPVAQMCMRYLEFLVEERGDTERLHHTQLAKLYLDSVKTLRSTLAPETAAGTHRMRPAPGTEEGPLGKVRGKLITLLRDSDYYDVAALLSATEGTTLFEERMLLFSKQDNHEEALKLIVYDLADLNRAAEYGITHHKPGNEDGNDPFMVLLKIYFGDRSRAAEFTAEAMKVLRKYGTSINPAEVLRTLPLDLPVRDLANYLQQIIPNNAHKARQASVVKSLYRYEHVRVNSELIEQRRRNVLITANTLCSVCMLRLGDAMFAVYPNDKVAHMHCASESLTCDPETGEKFRARR